MEVRLSNFRFLQNLFDFFSPPQCHPAAFLRNGMAVPITSHHFRWPTDAWCLMHAWWVMVECLWLLDLGYGASLLPQHKKTWFGNLRRKPSLFPQQKKHGFCEAHLSPQQKTKQVLQQKKHGFCEGHLSPQQKQTGFATVARKNLDRLLTFPPAHEFQKSMKIAGHQKDPRVPWKWKPWQNQCSEILNH